MGFANVQSNVKWNSRSREKELMHTFTLEKSHDRSKHTTAI